MRRGINKLHSLMVFGLVLALAGSMGCKKDQSAANAQNDSAKTELKADVGLVAMPGDVIAYGGVRSLDELAKALGDIVGAFNPQMKALVTAQVQAIFQAQVLGVNDMSWMDREIPITFAILDYKKFAQPYVVIVPFKAKEALIASLPGNQTPGTPDNELRYASAMGTQIFLNIVDNRAVFTMEPGAFTTVKAFIEGPFRTYPFTELADVQVSVKNVRSIASDDIAQAREQMATMAASQPAVPMPGIQELFMKEMEFMFGLLEQTDSARLVLKFDGKDLTLDMALKVLAGKDLSRFAASAAGRKMNLYKNLPEGGWMAIASNLDPKLFSSLMDMYMGFYKDLFQFSEEEFKQFTDMTTKVIAIQKGDTAIWIGHDGEFPFKILSLTDIQGGEETRKLLYDYYGMFFSKAGAMVQKYSGPDMKAMPPLDWTNFSKFVESAKPIMATSGVTMNLQAKKSGELSMDILDMTVDYSKVPGAAQNPEIERVSKMMGNKLSGGLGFDQDTLYFAFGKDAGASIEEVASKKGTGGGLLKSMVEKTNTSVGLAMYLSATEVLKLVARFDQTIAMTFPALEKSNVPAGVGFIIGGRDETTIDGTLTLPIADLALLMATQTPVQTPEPPPQVDDPTAAPVAPVQ